MRQIAWLSSISLVAIAALSRPVHAQQCPDGRQRTERGCAGERTAPRALDANRIAVFPLRTSSGDSELAQIGSGIMELLAVEFNGAVGPEAVEPGEALRAWQQAGGSRRPPTNGTYVAAARALGAGQVAIGSLVAAGGRLTLGVAIHNVGNGAVRVPRVQVEGTADSLSNLTAILATRLLGREAGVAQSAPNDAVRAYLDGIAAYRKTPFDWPYVSRNLLRATQLDSTLLQASYRLVLLNALVGPANLGIRGYEGAYRHLWRERHRLLNEQRILLEALGDSSGLFFRMKSLRLLEQAIQALPNSAEAWHILSGLYWFSGAAIGIEDWKDKAKAAANRAIALNANLCRGCGHGTLASVAYLEGNSREFARYAGKEPWDRWRGAILRKDASEARVARRDYVNEVSGSLLESRLLPDLLTGTPLPVAQIDSFLLELQPLATSERKRRSLAGWIAQHEHHAGRPNRSRAAVREMFGSDTSNEYYGALLDYAYDDSAVAERVSMLAVDQTANALRPQIRAMFTCGPSLSRLRRGDTTGVRAVLDRSPVPDVGLEEILAGIKPGQTDKVCAVVLRGVFGAFQPSGAHLLHRADSLMRIMPLNVHHENYDLGHAFARLGEYALAAAAVRRYTRGVGVWPRSRQVISLRHEGRWATLAGDTAAAMRAYREYLIYRADPEPVLVPERDSVKAELVALEKAYRKPAPKRAGPK